MMRLRPSGPAAIRHALCVASCAYGLVAASALTGHAGQLRAVTDGVYSAGQAARGQQLYEAQCAECHGKAMEGTIGPPLVGNDFLLAWSARPLSNLVDKIQKTMPFNLPASLSRQQATDLAADMLRALKFPTGPAELTEPTLAQITFPTGRPASVRAATSAGASAPAPEGNLAELMRAITFPNSNIIFNVQVKDPGAQPKKAPSAPFDYAEWGSTVYPGWLAVDQAAVALTETAHLLLTPGRRCQNGRPVPVDRADWKQYVAALADVGKIARRASQERNYEAFIDISEKLDETCVNCHKVYRDKGGPEGSGAARCQ